METNEAIEYLEKHSYLFIDRLPYKDQQRLINKLDEAIKRLKYDSIDEWFANLPFEQKKGLYDNHIRILAENL